jgi:hypothetical protein
MKKKRSFRKREGKKPPPSIEEAFGTDSAYDHARERAQRNLENPPNLGPLGKITWTRDELHERHPTKKS